MPNALAVTLQALGAVSSSSSGSSVDIGAVRGGIVLVGEILAVSGTSPVMTLEIETSPDDSSWRPLRTLQSYAGTDKIGPFHVLDCSQYVRAKWTLSGSGATFTFSLSATAHTVYARQGDSRIHPGRLKPLSVDDIAEELIKASSVADDYIGSAYGMPLLSWGQGLRSYVARIADYELIHRIGYNPDGVDDDYRLRADAAVKALKDVAAGRMSLDGVVDSTEAVKETAAYVYSATAKRGWQT